METGASSILDRGVLVLELQAGLGPLKWMLVGTQACAYHGVASSHRTRLRGSHYTY